MVCLYPPSSILKKSTDEGDFMMRMLLLYSFIFFLILPSTNHAGGYGESVLTQLMDGLEGYDHTVSEWNITIKEQMTKENALKKIQQLKSEFDVLEEDADKSRKYRAIDRNQASASDIHYVIILPDVNHYKAEMIVSIIGHNWSESINETSMEQVKTIKRNYFTNRSKTFACLTAKVHDTINSVYFVDKMKESYQADILLEQTDANEDSMIKNIKYGYTPLWH